LASGVDYLTVAYSPAGTGLWTNRFNGPDNGDDVASAIVVDTSGNDFVTGHTTRATGSPVCVTIAYSDSGAALWTNTYQSAGESAWGKAVATDQNRVIVAGSAGTALGYDFLTLAYSVTGQPLWTNRYDGPANGDDEALALALYRGGNATVTGPSRGSNSIDYATVAYSIDSGLPLWTNRYDGPAGSVDEARAVTVDLEGSVFVTGQSIGLAGDFDIVTIKYSSSARPQLQSSNDNARMILSWTSPTYSLQSASVISGVFTNIPGASSPYTNWFSGRQQYFRLINR